jgi:hypothetical protein
MPIALASFRQHSPTGPTYRRGRIEADARYEGELSLLPESALPLNFTIEDSSIPIGAA